MRQKLMAALVGAMMIGTIVAAAGPVVARASSGSLACTDVQVSTFSAAQMSAARHHWTSQRIAAVAHMGQASQGKWASAAITAPQRALEPATMTRCAAPASPGQSSGAPRPPQVPDFREATGSVAGTAFAGYENVGALFEDNNETLTPHCTAATISPPSGDANPQDLQSLVLTAAHCVKPVRGGTVQSVTDLAFIPQFDSNGQDNEPFGLWTVSSVVVDSRWTRCTSGCPQYDYAILILAPNNGTQLGSIVGENGWSVSEPKTVRNAEIVGYPDASIRPLLAISKVETINAGGHSYRRADSTPLFGNGTSGGPFFASYDTTTGTGVMFGNIGGYQRGGYSDSPSYSLYWTSAFTRLVATAFTLE